MRHFAAFSANYSVGIDRNYSFNDGNMRTAAEIMETFLVHNGHTLAASGSKLIVAILAVDASELAEEGGGVERAAADLRPSLVISRLSPVCLPRNSIPSNWGAILVA